jgi:two-component system sensor histidine kinase/response regulator
MPKILIVDDQTANRLMLKNVLAKANPDYEFLEAASGGQGLEILKGGGAADIILLDVMMPDMDGFEVCSRLKSDPKASSVPVIFITALEKTEDKVKGFQAGGADYITKPINPEEARARIAAHLRIRKADEERRALENLEAVKNMVVTCNHNMNQPLMAALTYLEILLSTTDKADKKYGTLQKMKNELGQLAAILKKIQSLDKLKRVDYVGDVQMIDLNP